MSKFFVTGISTGVGKTIVSAVLTKALNATYWKPVQTGLERDTDTVTQLTGCTTLPERFHFKNPVSPHQAAKEEGQEIRVSDFSLPSISPLIVEGAGGLLSPLSDTLTNADLVQHLKIPAFLVSSLYLGGINHTLLTIEALQKRSIPIEGIIVSGEWIEESVRAIESLSGLKIICHIQKIALTKEAVSKEALRIQDVISRV